MKEMYEYVEQSHSEYIVRENVFFFFSSKINKRSDFS